MKHYRRRRTSIPILDAFRDTRGPRWEVRFTNRGDKPSRLRHRPRLQPPPLGHERAGIVARASRPAQSSDWVPLLQDTSHFSMVRFSRLARQPFDVESAAGPAASEVERKLSGDEPRSRSTCRPIPARARKPITPEEEIDAVLKELRDTPAPGKKPTKPLCYGGWMPLGQDNDYGRKYAELYAALGFRSLHPANSGPAQVKNLEAVGVPPSARAGPSRATATRRRRRTSPRPRRIWPAAA